MDEIEKEIPEVVEQPVEETVVAPAEDETTEENIVA